MGPADARSVGVRPSLRARRLVVVAAALTCGLHSPGGAVGATGGPQIAPRHDVVTVLATHPVRSGPDASAERVGQVAPRRPITAVRTVLPVLGRATDGLGRGWLRVRLPGRVLGGAPPPRTGWISTPRTLPSVTRWHVVVDLGARRLLVHHDGRRVRSYPVVVGARPTPTPRGRYFVEENVRLPRDRVGAPFALALSARSSVYQEFAGGPGQIAIHGLGNVGGRPGTAASHGCVRLADGPIAWLAARIRPGVPVTIR